MSNALFQPPLGQQPIIGVADIDTTRAFLARVFTYMGLAMVISGIGAWAFANVPALSEIIRTAGPKPGTFKPTGIGWVVAFAPLALVFLMGGMVNRLSGSALLGIFILYAALTGMGLSTIFLVYTGASITNIFVVSALLFGAMATLGYTTKTDLTKLGSILMIGLIGIVIASVVNIFLGSSTMGFVISMISVVIFTGLTAYDMQRLKGMAGFVVNGTELAQKMALMGALSLYLDFLNLFLALLRLFGNRRN